jgi:hypothetical protein
MKEVYHLLMPLLRLLLRLQRIESPLTPKLQSDHLFVEYYTTSEVAKYLGLTYENYYDLPTKDPNTLKKIFDLGEFVHRLINSDIYGQMAEMQDEQMKERREFRKNVLKK